ncbi:MAG TPA: hypothetical protein VNJ09_00875 [Chthonomonadales bacterium]|nr:hypothetical protein [Chthonomonadales bacterium]
MKAVLTLFVVALLALNIYNWWEIRNLHQEIARLNHQVEQTPPDLTDQVVAEATRALARAREAIGKMDLEHARVAVEDARQRLEEARRSASEKVRPTVKWLGEQVTELGRRIQVKAGANR